MWTLTPNGQICRVGSQSEISPIRADLDSAGWSTLDIKNSEEMNSFVQSLGPVILDPRTGSTFTDLIPYESRSAPKESMSSIIGTGEQPMHTDGAHLCEPPRYIALLCLDPGEAICPTQIWRVDASEQGDWPLLLTDPIWIFHDGVGQPFYSPIVQFHNKALKVRFDSCCIRAASQSHFSATDALNALKQCASPSVVQWCKGKAVIIDNWRCLHARGAGGGSAPSRRLRRWHLGSWEDGMVKRSSL